MLYPGWNSLLDFNLTLFNKGYQVGYSKSHFADVILIVYFVFVAYISKIHYLYKTNCNPFNDRISERGSNALFRIKPPLGFYWMLLNKKYTYQIGLQQSHFADVI